MKLLLPLLYLVMMGSVYAQSKLPPCQNDTNRNNCSGVITYPDGSRYVGEFKSNKPDGWGTFFYPPNQMYGKFEGEWKNGVRNGVGAFYSQNDRLDGIYIFSSNDLTLSSLPIFLEKKEAALTISKLATQTNTPSNSIRYDNIATNLPACRGSDISKWTDCFGTISQNLGEKYEGEFKNGTRQGQGTFTLVDGSKYVGEFRGGWATGLGTYTYLDGRKYVGEFQLLQFHGPGTIYAANGSIIRQGIWANDRFVRSEPVQQVTTPNTELEKLRAEAEEAKRKQAELEQQLRLAQTTQNQPPPVINQGRRVALVIGNASYSSVPQLMNPTNDAREVTRALQATGFEVIRLENADLRQMQDAVRSFGSKLGKNDVGLFYFSGHGVQVKGKNYLIPVRENIKQSFEVPSGAIDADLVLATMENAKNNLNIMILDACRSPFPGEARSLSRGLATLDAAKGTLIAYATAPGKEALDGQGSNSPYTKHLVRALQQKGLPIEQVFKQVRIAVVEETKGNQVPWENSSIMGDFYFRK